MKFNSGNITTQNLVPAGTATAGSVVEVIDLTDESTLAIQVTGTFDAALTLQARANGDTWVDLSGLTDVNGGATVAAIPIAGGLFKADCSGFDAVRVSANAAITGSARVSMRATSGKSSSANVSVDLGTSDIQIGAVEIKDGGSDNRGAVSTAGQQLVNSGGASPSVAISRPENTTDYAAGDAIGIADAGTPANAGSAIIEFANAAPAAGQILLVDWSLRIDLAAVPSGMGAFRLHLYNAAPDAILDNAAWDLSSAGDRSKYLGYIDMGSPLDVGSTLFSQVQNQPKQVAAASTSLFGVLVTLGAYTPASATVYTPKLNIANV